MAIRSARLWIPAGGSGGNMAPPRRGTTMVAPSVPTGIVASMQANSLVFSGIRAIQVDWER
jgi:hypothetical protein